MIHTAAVHPGVIHTAVVAARVVHAGVFHDAVVHDAVVHDAVAYAHVVVIARRRTLRDCRKQLHAALWAVTRLIAHYLRMHRTCIGGHGGAWLAISFMPHLGQRLGSVDCRPFCAGDPGRILPGLSWRLRGPETAIPGPGSPGGPSDRRPAPLPRTRSPGGAAPGSRRRPACRNARARRG
jgi:hypothetical protein